MEFIMINYTFTDRTTYIAACAQWRADYKALSAKIRETRQAFRNAQREFSAADISHIVEYGVYSLSSTDPRRIAYFKTSGLVDQLRRELQVLRTEATEMLSTRQSMKEEAQDQYLAKLSDDEYLARAAKGTLYLSASRT
jgi:hypothetical protein